MPKKLRLVFSRHARRCAQHEPCKNIGRSSKFTHAGHNSATIRSDRKTYKISIIISSSLTREKLSQPRNRAARPRPERRNKQKETNGPGETHSIITATEKRDRTNRTWFSAEINNISGEKSPDGRKVVPDDTQHQRRIIVSHVASEFCNHWHVCTIQIERYICLHTSKLTP